MIGTTDITKDLTLELFPSPDQVDPKLESFLEEACSSLCAWFSETNRTGPLPEVKDFPEVSPRQKGLSSKELLGDLEMIMRGAYQPSHPGALAHLDPPPLSASIVGDLICSGLNNNLLAEELSPTLTKLENSICSWMAKEIGMKTKASGVAASGGSISNLMALVLARYKANLSYDPNAVICTSSEAHVSISRALKIMGLPPEALQTIPTDIDGQLLMSSLKEQLSYIHQSGRKCFAVVATAGTTIRGSIDPLNEISQYCLSEGIWFHVDASIGGVFALSEKTKSLVKGISLADSVTVNPQKLLGITKTSSLLLVQDKENLASCFSTGFPYIEPSCESLVNGGDLGVQGTRSAEVLKLWLGLRQLGQDGIEELLLNAVKRKNYFKSRLSENKFDIITGPLHLIAFTPKGLNKKQSEEWSLHTKALLMNNQFMLSRPRLDGRYYLKAVFGNPHTFTHHIDQLANLINQST